MPRPSCNPCCNPGEMSRTKESFQASELIILCDILEAVGGGEDAGNRITYRQNYTAAETDTIVVAAAANERIVVYRLSVLADHINGDDVGVVVGFGAVTTPTDLGVVLAHPGIVPGSGVIEGCAGGVLGIGAPGEDLRITSEDPLGGSIDVVVTYKIEVV